MSDRSNREKRENKEIQNLKKTIFILLLLIIMALVSVTDGAPERPPVVSNIQQQRRKSQNYLVINALHLYYRFCKDRSL